MKIAVPKAFGILTANHLCWSPLGILQDFFFTLTLQIFFSGKSLKNLINFLQTILF